MIMDNIYYIYKYTWVDIYKHAKRERRKEREEEEEEEGMGRQQ